MTFAMVAALVVTVVTFAMVTALMVTVMAFAMVTALMVTVVTFAMVAATAVAMFVAAMMLLGREELAVKPLFEFLLGRFPHLFDSTLEMKRLPGHGMVEIHGHGIFLDLADQALDHLSGAIQHGNELARLEEFLHQAAVYHKGRLAQVDAFVGLVGAVAFLRGKGEGEGLRRLQALELLLELGQQHVGAVDIIQVVVLHHLPVDGKFVMEQYYFILIDFHMVMN